jgi:hypothetical protein
MNGIMAVAITARELGAILQSKSSKPVRAAECRNPPSRLILPGASVTSPQE